MRYNAVPPEVYRGFGFPGADDLGNMFQFKRDFNEMYCAARDLEFSRALNPELQTFDQWLNANAGRIPDRVVPSRLAEGRGRQIRPRNRYQGGQGAAEPSFVPPNCLPAGEEFPKTIPLPKAGGRGCDANSLLLEHCSAWRTPPVNYKGYTVYLVAA